MTQFKKFYYKDEAYGDFDFEVNFELSSLSIIHSGSDPIQYVETKGISEEQCDEVQILLQRLLSWKDLYEEKSPSVHDEYSVYCTITLDDSKKVMQGLPPEDFDYFVLEFNRIFGLQYYDDGIPLSFYTQPIDDVSYADYEEYQGACFAGLKTFRNGGVKSVVEVDKYNREAQVIGKNGISMLVTYMQPEEQRIGKIKCISTNQDKGDLEYDTYCEQSFALMFYLQKQALSNHYWNSSVADSLRKVFDLDKDTYDFIYNISHIDTLKLNANNYVGCHYIENLIEQFEKKVPSGLRHLVSGLDWYEMSITPFDRLIHQELFWTIKALQEQCKLWDGVTDTTYEKLMRIKKGQCLKVSYKTVESKNNGDIIYLSCAFDVGNDEKTFYYLTDDDTIDCGDDVIVPVGDDNKQKRVTVIMKEYFQPNDVPFPVERTKSIIRKAEMPPECYCPLFHKVIEPEMCERIIQVEKGELKSWYIINDYFDMNGKRELCRNCKNYSKEN